MDTEEDEAFNGPKSQPSIQSEVKSATTAAVMELPQENTESQCQPESVAELDAPTVSSAAEPEDGKEFVDGKVAPESTSVAVVDGEEGVGDLIGGEEKQGNVDGDDALETLCPDGRKNNGEDAFDGEDSRAAEEEKPEMEEDEKVSPNVAEDAAVVDMAEKATKDDVAEERETTERTEVAYVIEHKPILEEAKEADFLERQVTELAEDIGIRGEKEVADRVERTEIPEETEVVDMVNGGGIAEGANVTDMMDERGISQETDTANVVEKTEIPEETELVDEVDGRGIAHEANVADMVDGRGVLEETELVNVVGQSARPEGSEAGLTKIQESPGEEQIVDVADQTGILEETEVADMAEEREIPEKDSAEEAGQTGVLEETNVPEELERRLEMEVVEVATHAEMGEEMEKADDTEMANFVEDAEKAEETETQVGHLAEGMEQAEDTDMAEPTEGMETEVAEETEEADDVDGEVSKTSSGKRKRGKNSKLLVRSTSRKKVEEDVCFICFDGGDLVLCDRRGCPKAYHPSCVGRDEAFFRSKGRWNCGWHQCSNCKKSAYYMCYTCTFSLCKGCIKDAVIFCVRGNKGLCQSCMNLVLLIERNEQENKEMEQLDFDDKNSWEYLFKDYWIDLKGRLSITSDEVAQAKNPWKGSELRAAKQEHDDTNKDKGSESDSSSMNAEVTASRRRKTRSRLRSHAKEGESPSTVTAFGVGGASTGDNVEWASKELLEVVAHMRNGDKSVLSRIELNQLILDYIKKHELRDRRNKSYVICDSRLKNLFGKPRVGHIEMLNLLDPHIFFTKEDSQTDDLQGSVVDNEANQLEADWNSDVTVKASKDKKRKPRKKGDTRGPQANVDDYAAIDMHNINLIYLRRNLMEDLLEDTETFHEKVVGSFVRIRISGAGQKQDLYRLVQVIGTSKVAEPYRVGKKTTDFLLEILNLNKTEVISIDIISNQEFTEDECKRLRQSIKCGLINRLTVGDIQEKAAALQEVRVKDWLEAEIVRLSHLRDRASEKGHRKELRECVEKLQLLKTPEERQSRLEKIPEIHVDPNMDPSYESEEDEGETDDRRQDNYLRPRGSSFNRRGREPISPRKGGFGSNDSWSGTRNYPSMNRELGRNMPGKGLSSKGDDFIGAGEAATETLWVLGRDRETQQPNSWDKPKSASHVESGVMNARTVEMQELSSKIVPEIPPAPLSTGATAVGQINETEKIWHYRDPSGKVQGPFSVVQLRKWSNTGYFPADLRIWRKSEKQDDSILLTDVLAGKFHKHTAVDDSFLKGQKALYSGISLGAPMRQGMEVQAGDRSKFDQNHAAWSPTPALGSSGQSQPEIGSSTGRPAPALLDMPTYSREAWNIETNLPSPTPNQHATGGISGQTFESKWSPKSTQPSGSLSVANPFRGGNGGLQPHAAVVSERSPAPKPDNSMLLSSANVQMHSQPLVSGESQRIQVNVQTSVNPGADLKNAVLSLQNLVQPVSSHNPLVETHRWGSGSVSRPETVAQSSILATGTQTWASASSQKLDSNAPLMPAQPVAYGQWGDSSSSVHNPSASFSTGHPAGSFPAPGQLGLPASDAWRPPVAGQSNAQPAAVPNLSWGMGATDNQSAPPRQGPGNHNPSWGPMAGNPNVGWGAPVPMNTNVNWAASSQGSAAGSANPSWTAPGQGQMPANANPGWAAPGNANQGWGQGPGLVNAGAGWIAPGQGVGPGNANPGWAAPSGNTGMWGSEQNHNGERFSNPMDRGAQGGDSVHGGVKPWNRQSSFGAGGVPSRTPPVKGQRVCKYHESGHCKKGAQCDYLHS